MERGWNKGSALKQLLYAVVYTVGFVVTCVLGSVHPIMFVCYQVTASVLLTGVCVKAFDSIRAPGVAISFAVMIFLTFLAIRDVSPWHCIPLVVLAIAAEVVGLALGNGTWRAVVAKSAIMSFTTFGYYGQIWLNRDFTYVSAVEEMPAGYADGLMACSPGWAFPAVIVLGVVVSVLIAHLTARLFKIGRD